MSAPKCGISMIEWYQLWRRQKTYREFVEKLTLRQINLMAPHAGIIETFEPLTVPNGETINMGTKFTTINMRTKVTFPSEPDMDPKLVMKRSVASADAGKHAIGFFDDTAAVPIFVDQPATVAEKPSVGFFKKHVDQGIIDNAMMMEKSSNVFVLGKNLVGGGGQMRYVPLERGDDPKEPVGIEQRLLEENIRLREELAEQREDHERCLKEWMKKFDVLARQYDAVMKYYELSAKTQEPRRSCPTGHPGPIGPRDGPDGPQGATGPDGWQKETTVLIPRSEQVRRRSLVSHDGKIFGGQGVAPVPGAIGHEPGCQGQGPVGIRSECEDCGVHNGEIHKPGCRIYQALMVTAKSINMMTLPPGHHMMTMPPEPADPTAVPPRDGSVWNLGFAKITEPEDKGALPTAEAPPEPEPQPSGSWRDRPSML